MKNSSPIGVFDSGVGGLSILRELQLLLPGEDFVFLADQLHVPYGEKSNNELVELGSRTTDYFVQSHDIKMLVIACNTSTCGAIGELRAKFAIPIVGTVPAIKKAAEQTQTKVIACISTPSTSKSPLVKDLIANHCRGLDVLNIGCQGLEDLVERGNLNSTRIDGLLHKYLLSVRESNADCLVLGCTHYPFLKNQIISILGHSVELIDSGEAVARRARHLLKVNDIASDMTNHDSGTGKTTYFTTGDPVKFAGVATELLGRSVEASKVELQSLGGLEFHKTLDACPETAPVA
jgi:glutamate racemase